MIITTSLHHFLRVSKHGGYYYRVETILLIIKQSCLYWYKSCRTRAVNHFWLQIIKLIRTMNSLSDRWLMYTKARVIKMAIKMSTEREAKKCRFKFREGPWGWEMSFISKLKLVYYGNTVIGWYPLTPNCNCHHSIRHPIEMGFRNIINDKSDHT